MTILPAALVVVCCVVVVPVTGSVVVVVVVVCATDVPSDTAQSRLASKSFIDLVGFIGLP